MHTPAFKHTAHPESLHVSLGPHFVMLHPYWIKFSLPSKLYAQYYNDDMKKLFFFVLFFEIFLNL